MTSREAELTDRLLRLEEHMEQTAMLRYGTVSGILGEAVVPTFKPDDAEMLPADGAVTWFATALSASAVKGVWLKILKDDDNPYEGVVDGAEIHLLDTDPDPESGDDFQWNQIGFVSGDGTSLSAGSILKGHQRATRHGGPGADYLLVTI